MDCLAHLLTGFSDGSIVLRPADRERIAELLLASVQKDSVAMDIGEGDQFPVPVVEQDVAAESVGVSDDVQDQIQSQVVRQPQELSGGASATTSTAIVPAVSGAESNFGSSTGGSRKRSRSVRSGYRVPMVPIDELRTMDCSCASNCLHQFTRKQLLTARTNFKVDNATYTKERQALLDRFADESNRDGYFVHFFKGSIICPKAMYSLYDISRSRYYDVRNAFYSGIRSAQIKWLPAKSEKRDGVESWITWWVNTNSEFLPHKDRIVLPRVTQLKHMHNQYNASANEMGRQPVSYGYFIKVFFLHFKGKVTIGRKTEFSKCDICCSLKSDLTKLSTRDGEQLRELSRQMTAHITLQREQRDKFDEEIFNSLLHPLHTMVYHTDVAENFSSLQDAHKLRTHVFGTWFFGRELLCYIDCREWPHNTSANITALLLAIHKYRHSLPTRLYLQYDNTCSQNKNNIMFAFCAYLVEKGIFREVQIGFMMKGHTHSCLDRVFSRVSKKLKGTPTVTYEALVHKIESSFKTRNSVGLPTTTTPTVDEFQLVYDFKGWFDKQLLEELIHADKYHQFKFNLMEETGKCVMYYAEWARDSFSALPPKDVS